MTDLLRIDKQLCVALYAAQRAMTRAYAPLLEPLGLTYPQYLVLMALHERRRATVGELGDSLSLDSGTLSPLLKRMEEDGLVARSRSESDERVVQVVLTPKGALTIAKAADVPRRMLECAGMQAKDAAKLRDQLKDLYRRLNQETK